MADCSVSGTALDRILQIASLSTPHAPLTSLNGSKGSILESTVKGLTQIGGNAQHLPGVNGGGFMSESVPMGGRVSMRPNSVYNGQQQGQQQGQQVSQGQMEEAWGVQEMQQVPQMQQQQQQQQQQHYHQAQHQQAQQQAHQQAQQNQQNAYQFHAAQSQMTHQKSYIQKARDREALRLQLKNDIATKSLDAAWAVSVEQERMLQELRDVDDFDEQVKGASVQELSEAWKSTEKEFWDDTVKNGTYDDDRNVYDSYGNVINTSNNLEYSFNQQSSSEYNNVQDPYDQGMRFFYEGKLLDAIQCFETSLSRADSKNNLKTWKMLALSHSENDDDIKSIQAYKQVLGIDPYDNDALLSLSVCYVNEMDMDNAMDNLRQLADNYGASTLGSGSVMEDVSESNGISELHEYDLNYTPKHLLPGSELNPSILIKSLQNCMRNASSDSGGSSQLVLLEALSVLQNVEKEYDGAIESLSQAISLLQNNPDESTDLKLYNLWNKLGATLANSKRSSSALHCYSKSLELRPRFVRAWSNLGVAYSNLRDYKEASRCYLQTLALNPGGKHVWSYLRISLTCEERWELLKSATRMEIEEFVGVGYDFIRPD